MTKTKYENVDIEIETTRWKLFVKITDHDKQTVVQEYVISADLAQTDGSGIYFSTRDSYEEGLDERFP